MRIYRASASSVGVYKFCPWQYFMQYVLQMEAASGKAALQGSIVHQVFEWIGLLVKRGKYLPPDWLLDQAWQVHTALNPEIEIRRETSRGEAADYRLCRTSVEKVIADPIYNPYGLKIIDTERGFDFEMPGEQWVVAMPDGSASQFRLRGYIDLVHEVNPRTIEIIDWKTGKRQDWRTMQVKDFYDLMGDTQPRFYHFAASQLYPGYDNVLVTFYYVNDGGPMTLPFTFEDIIPTLGSVWQFCDTVRRDGNMQRNRSWKCSRFCSFGRTGVCDSVWADLHALGQDAVEARYHRMSIAEQRKIVGGV